MPHIVLGSATLFFLCYLFGKTERYLLVDLSFCRKDNLKKISFCHLLDIFSLWQKDNLKKTTFSYLLVFCAVWDPIYKVNHNGCMLRFTMRDKLPTVTVINQGRYS